MSDRMTRHAPNTNSDHYIKFTTPSGIGESDQYLKIIFDTGFDLSVISFGDFDLFHGPVTGLETQEQISADIQTDKWRILVQANEIFIYHPSNSLIGDILPNDIVIVKIGLNTTSGDNQIRNPATIGSKTLVLSGTFGDMGKLAVPIFLDQISAGQVGSTPPLFGDVTCDNDGVCPFFIDPAPLSGGKPANTTVFINGSSIGITYPTDLTWQSLTNLNIGINSLVIYAEDVYNQKTADLNIDIYRYGVGDTNGDRVVNDFDLSGLAINFYTSWCYADFDHNNLVDDFDLSALAANWNNTY